MFNMGYAIHAIFLSALFVTTFFTIYKNKKLDSLTEPQAFMFLYIMTLIVAIILYPLEVFGHYFISIIWN